jgi:hypothetical protein
LLSSTRAHGLLAAPTDEGETSDHSEKTKKRNIENELKDASSENSNLKIELRVGEEKLQLALPRNSEPRLASSELTPCRAAG